MWPPRRQCGEIYIPALGANECQISQGRLGARQNNQIDIARDGRTRQHGNHVNVRFGDQWVEIIEIGDEG